MNLTKIHIIGSERLHETVLHSESSSMSNVVGKGLPRSSNQYLQLWECPSCAESMGQKGYRDTKDWIPWAMSVKYQASGIPSWKQSLKASPQQTTKISCEDDTSLPWISAKSRVQKEKSQLQHENFSFPPSLPHEWVAIRTVGKPLLYVFRGNVWIHAVHLPNYPLEAHPLSLRGRVQIWQAWGCTEVIHHVLKQI